MPFFTNRSKSVSLIDLCQLRVAIFCRATLTKWQDGYEVEPPGAAAMLCQFTATTRCYNIPSRDNVTSEARAPRSLSSQNWGLPSLLLLPLLPDFTDLDFTNLSEGVIEKAPQLHPLALLIHPK